MRLILGDSREELRGLEPESIDALCTDPPAGIAFMGKTWDSDKGGRDDWIEWLRGVMQLVYMVLKPGAHGLVWALPRTSHWTATALENAGFEIRDVIMHVFGSGFPKSLNLPDGIGTALKPAAEHWILVRKPLAGTVAANVLEHGTGGLNIEGCRVGTSGGGSSCPGGDSCHCGTNQVFGATKHPPRIDGDTGRWPPHLLLSHSPDCAERCVKGCPVRVVDEQSGAGVDGVAVSRHGGGGHFFGGINPKYPPDRTPRPDQGYGGQGGASRFFPRFRYQPKPSRAEREAGCEHLPGMTRGEAVGRDPESAGAQNPRAGANRIATVRDVGGGVHNKDVPLAKNFHPTLKSLDLMRWLVRLITPPGGVVLDPFMGSGTTGCACACEGFDFVGIEQDPEYVQIARARIEYYSASRHEIENDDTPRPQAVGQGVLW